MSDAVPVGVSVTIRARRWRSITTVIVTVLAIFGSMMARGTETAHAAVPPEVSFTTMVADHDLLPDDGIISNPATITRDADGNLWFTNTTANSIGRITVMGVVSTFTGPGISSPVGITAGSDDNLWFTNAGNNSIGRITTAGVVSNFTGAGISSPRTLATGPDGNLWFANYGNNSIGRITTAGVVSNFTGTGISLPIGITAGPDGKLWFTNAGNNSIGRITTAGVVSNFTGTGISYPAGIASGPDGNLWFANFLNDSIGRITTAGVVSNFTGTGISNPYGITAGPDGKLWFANSGNNSIGRITTAGVVSNFTGIGISTAGWMVAGTDGNLWFTNNGNNSIGRITTAGVVSNFTGGSTGTISTPLTVTAGPGGNVWFTHPYNNSIGRITPSGVVSNFTGTGISLPMGIAVGPDGNLWFTNNGNNSIGRITPSGVVSNFTGTGISSPYNIAAGPDGNLWFTNLGNHSIGRITTAGVVSNFTGTGISSPFNIAAGPDGNLWFTNMANNSIGRITTAGVVSNFTGTGISSPLGIAEGPDGNLWFANFNNGSLGRITTAGVVSNFTGTGISSPRVITQGPDGNLWFANVDSIMRVNLAGAFHPMSPARIIDSRSSSQVGPYSTPWGTGTTRNVSVAGVAGVPVDATAVVLNVTGVTPSANTYLTLWPKGQSRPTASNLNLPPGDVRPNLVMSSLGTDGAVSLYNNLGNTDVVIDVVGWYGPGADASYFNELSPSRIWDTRPAPENVGPFGKLGQGQTKDLTVTGAGGVPNGATAVVMNVTAVNPSYSTHVTAWPKGQARPIASNLNVPAGDVRPNLVVAKVGTDGKVSFYNNAGTTDLVVDVVGYFADTGSQFNGMTPKRVWDSRPAPENVGPLGKLGQGATQTIKVAGANGVPADAKAVVVNITGVSPSYSTYITAWPTGESRPTASNLNLTQNSVIPNLAVVKVGAGGKINIYNNLGTTDVVVDVVGWYR